MAPTPANKQGHRLPRVPKVAGSSRAFQTQTYRTLVPRCSLRPSCAGLLTNNLDSNPEPGKGYSPGEVSLLELLSDKPETPPH